MAHSRGRFSRGSGPRRQTSWVGPSDQNFVGVATGATSIISSFVPSTNGLRKSTLVRNRGIFSVKPDSLAADVDIVGAMGVCVVSNQAFSAGAGSIPGPFDEAGWDGWMVWQPFGFSIEVIGAPTDTLLSAIQIEVDSKAMRKVSDNETVVVMCESNTGAMEVFDGIRQLYKLA